MSWSLLSMKSCYLDANVLVYFKDESSPHHEEAVSMIEQMVAERYTLYISPLVLDEFLYVATYYLKQTKLPDWTGKLRKYLAAILAIPNVHLVSPSDDKKKQMMVVDYMEKCSLRPRDAYHLFIMKHWKIQYFATFDTDFDSLFSEGVIKRFPSAFSSMPGVDG